MARTPFFRGFSDELHKIAQQVRAIPVQRIPSGPSPAPQAPPRPPLPTAPAYRPPAPPPASTPKRGGAGGAKPVGSAWLSMADRAPTESTSKFVSRQYGVPEFQMGVNQGQRFYSGRADDPLSATVRTRQQRGAGPTWVQAKPTATAEQLGRVPSYLQKAVGGIVTPKPWLPRFGDLNAPNYLREDFTGAIPTAPNYQAAPQPAQATTG